MNKNRSRLAEGPLSRAAGASVAIQCGTIALALVGCQLGSNLENLAKQIGNPDKETFDTPQLFLEGEYRGLSIDGTSKTGPFITALRKDNHLVIMPFDSITECTVGPVRSYRPAMLKDADSRTEDARIPFITRETEDTPEQLRFTNFACEVSDVSLDTNLLPLSDNFPKAGGVVAQSAAGELWHINPWTDKRKRVATNAAPISRDNRALFADGVGGKRWMFTLEDSEIVARDNEFSEVFRSGSGFDAFVHHQASDKSIVLVARRREAMPDSDKTVAHWFSLPLDAPDSERLVAQDACSMRVSNGTTGRELLYSDCPTGDLRWYSYETDETETLAEGIKAYRMMGNGPDGPILLYLEHDDSDDSNVGPLYARWGTESPSFLGERGNLKMSWISSSGTQRPVVDWSDDRGTLKYGSVGKDLKTVAKGVVHVSSVGVISEYDGQNGVFSRLSGANLTEVYDQVHANGMRSDPDTERVLLVADIEDGRGSLILVNGEKHQILIDDVQPNAYQYAAAFPMVSVLNDYDDESGTATLRMVRTDRPQDIKIADGVRESLEIGWPEQGLLFSAPEGDPPGVYFAQAR